MASKGSFKDYQGTGFSDASGVEALQNQQSDIPTSQHALNQQAVSQYADTYETLNESFNQQLASLIVSQANDEKLLNEQYNNSIASMMAKLQKRGLQVTTALPEAQTAALNKHRNEAMAFRGSIYAVQRALPEQRLKLLKTGYDQEIARRIAANRQNNVSMATDLLTSISQLQFSSFEDYINYLLAKKAKSSGGGGGRRYSYSRSSSGASTGGSGGYVNTGDLKGSSKVYYNYNAGWQNRGGSRDSYDSGVRSAYKARK